MVASPAASGRQTHGFWPPFRGGREAGAHHILSAVGVDAKGKKHILGLEPGATGMPPVPNAA